VRPADTGESPASEESGWRRRGTKVRSTRQAAAVVAVLSVLPGYRGARDIHPSLHRDGGQAGLATVYRHLRVLTEQGAVDTIRGASGETLYCVRRDNFTRFLTCRACGHSVEVDGREIREWAEGGRRPGTWSSCPGCARRTQAASPLGPAHRALPRDRSPGPCSRACPHAARAQVPQRGAATARRQPAPGAAWPDARRAGQPARAPALHRHAASPAGGRGRSAHTGPYGYSPQFYVRTTDVSGVLDFDAKGGSSGATAEAMPGDGSGESELAVAAIAGDIQPPHKYTSEQRPLFGRRG